MQNKTKLGRALNARRGLGHFFSHEICSAIIPSSIDLRPNDTPIFDQGQEGSCTMNAGCGLYDYLAKQKKQNVITARNFGYWVERAFDGDTSQDNGSTLTTCAKVFNEKGVCQEYLWPYSPITFLPEPPDTCWADATKQKATQNFSLSQDLNTLKSCLAQGNPFIFGIAVYESFESAINGEIPMPSVFENILGGHALCCVGYDKDDRFIVRNSWGTNWGDSGYCYIPFAYLMNSNLAFDFWTFKI